MIWGLFDTVFAPILWINNPLWEILVIAIMVSLIITGMQKKLVDQERAKYLQKEVQSFNKELLSAHKNKDDKLVKQLQKKQPAIMEMQKEMMMKMQLPLFASMIPVLIIFMWIKHSYSGFGDFIMVPFYLPFNWAPLGWLGWYIFCSMPATIAMKKILRV